MRFLQDYFKNSGKDKNIFLYTLENNKGITVTITNYGGTVTSILVPGKNGQKDDVVLGFDNLEQYMAGHPYFGVICGRYANRIANAEFTLDGQKYSLSKNDGGNTLHGGLKGFDKVIWNAEPVKENNRVGVKLTYLSPDMEEGYPGNLKTKVSYYLNDFNELIIDYFATTDKPTVVNLTNHSYFNLNGCTSDILNHILTIHSKEITAINNEMIPNGKLVDIAGNAFDFNKQKQIGEDISKVAGGYDHNFVLNKPLNSMGLAARVIEPVSGRVMETYTTEPGVQLYTANFLDGTIIGKKGICYKKHFALCLEAQHYPDSPNHNNFQSTVLRPGKEYRQTTIYKFGIE